VVIELIVDLLKIWRTKKGSSSSNKSNSSSDSSNRASSSRDSSSKASSSDSSSKATLGTTTVWITEGERGTNPLPECYRKAMSDNPHKPHRPVKPPLETLGNKDNKAKASNLGTTEVEVDTEVVEEEDIEEAIAMSTTDSKTSMVIKIITRSKMVKTSSSHNGKEMIIKIIKEGAKTIIEEIGEVTISIEGITTTWYRDHLQVTNQCMEFRCTIHR